MGKGFLSGDGRWKAALMLLVAAMIVLRRPELLAAPRFWAEEATMYFSYAVGHGPWQSLMAPQFGYYSLFANLAGMLAAAVPLEHAPAVTTSLAFVFQMVPPAIVIYGNSPAWGSPARRAAVAAGILLLSYGEIWLNIICTQYWMTLAVFLVLLEEKEALGRARRLLYRALVLFCGLSSVSASFLAPAYILKALRTRLREDRVHAALLSAAAAVEAVVVLFSLRGGNEQLQSRFGQNRFMLTKVMEIQFGYPFYGRSRPGWMPAVPMGMHGWLSLAALGLSLYFVFLAAAGLRDRRRQLMTLCFLSVSVLSTLLSLQMTSSYRYAFAPSVMFLALIVSEFDLPSWKRPRKLVAALVLALILLRTGWNYRNMDWFWSPDWPRWKDEVRIWRYDNSYRVRIWPQWEPDALWDMELKYPGRDG